MEPDPCILQAARLPRNQAEIMTASPEITRISPHSPFSATPPVC
jgi:hypothetical protein